MRTVKPDCNQEENPSQTAGPYVHIGCTPRKVGIDALGEDLGASVFDESISDLRIRISGFLFDGNDQLVKDAMVEIWQADGQGNYATSKAGDSSGNVNGWGRCACDFHTGEYRFDTIKPECVPTYDGQLQAPHITLWIVARGINTGLHTRLYFSDEKAANDADPLLSSIDDLQQRGSMVAQLQSDGHYQLDIYLQGERETVFLDI